MIKFLQKEYLSAGTLTSTIRTFSWEEKNIIPDVKSVFLKDRIKPLKGRHPLSDFQKKKLPMYAKLWYRSTGEGGLGLMEEHEKLTHTVIYTNAL